MTLFALLIVMALERVTTKSKQFHIATLAQSYFSFLINKKYLSAKTDELAFVLMAIIPSVVAYLLTLWLPALLVFLLYIVVLWVCLGCPVTRQTYKRYLQAAHREDFQACSLHSMSFGNTGGELSNVGKQLVLVNYRQYASVIIFFIVLGIPGVIFYSLIKEWVMSQQQQAEASQQDDSSNDEHSESEAKQALPASCAIDEASPEVVRVSEQPGLASKMLFLLDWIPVRITAFGFLVVGHFSNALSAWFEVLLDTKISTYDALAKVSKAAEDVGDCDAHLNEPLQLVKLVKRNVIFMLMALSLMTMVGLVA